MCRGLTTTTAIARGGYVFMFGQGAVSWRSKRQSIVALSSTESEYIAATEATQESIWLRSIIRELGYDTPTTDMYGDNRGSIALSSSQIFHARTRHINARYHFIRQAIEEGIINFKWVPTDENIADLMTKALGRLSTMCSHPHVDLYPLSNDTRRGGVSEVNDDATDKGGNGEHRNDPTDVARRTE